MWVSCLVNECSFPTRLMKIPQIPFRRIRPHSVRMRRNVAHVATCIASEVPAECKPHHITPRSGAFIQSREVRIGPASGNCNLCECGWDTQDLKIFGHVNSKFQISIFCHPRSHIGWKFLFEAKLRSDQSNRVQIPYNTFPTFWPSPSPCQSLPHTRYTR